MLLAHSWLDRGQTLYRRLHRLFSIPEEMWQEILTSWKDTIYHAKASIVTPTKLPASWLVGLRLCAACWSCVVLILHSFTLGLSIHMISIRVVPRYQFLCQKHLNSRLFWQLGQSKIGKKGENSPTKIRTGYLPITMRMCIPQHHKNQVNIGTILSVLYYFIQMQLTLHVDGKNLSTNSPWDFE